ncbi:MAG: LptF/LptG family permease [Bryobacterales bacterium]|nr:LptF/LptG family permease [Bryobacterales bacterium]
MIISRYVFREVGSSALIGAVLCTFVIFLQQSVGKLFELLVRSSAGPETVVYLFVLAMAPVLPLTVPFGVLVGILIGLGRMSADGEITALRAAGVSSRKVIAPVLFFALLGTLLAGAASAWLTPLAIRETYRIFNRLAAAQLTAEIQPRVFEEQFPNTILYVGDVKPGPVVLWQNIFLADLTPPEQRTSGLGQQGQGPRITVAREAIAIPEPEHNRIQLSLRDASTHEVDKDSSGSHTAFPKGDQALQAAPPSERRARAFSEMDIRELPRHARSSPDWIEARIELHRRLALPLGCLMLALVGIPLGVSSRKGGRSGGYVMAIFLSFFCYYLAFISLIGLARQKALPVEAAAWTPNLTFALAGLVFVARMERPGDRDIVGAVRNWLGRVLRRLKHPLAAAPSRSQNGQRFPLLPQLVDNYVLSQFLFYFAVLVSAFVLMTHTYTFFELLSDIVKNRIPMSRVFTYHVFLTPKLIYDTVPVGILVAVLVTFGVMTKNNEVTAFKACGVSLFRLSLPVLVTGAALSAALFTFDYYYVPAANRIQDAIRNEIKGRPVQTYLRPDRKWIMGNGPRIYYYLYFDTAENVMVGVNVYELRLQPFRLVKQITAERAQWQPSIGSWVFQNGWERSLRGVKETAVRSFQATTFPELDEPPSYFLKEVKQDKQMNFQELERYIQDLQQSGFDTVKLRVQMHKKFSVPLAALIMGLIAVPFGFLVGNRGAMAGIGVSIGVAIVYWGVSQLFEQMGNVNQLPPALAAWSPNALFSLAGVYLLLRMRS